MKLKLLCICFVGFLAEPTFQKSAVELDSQKFQAKDCADYCSDPDFCQVLCNSACCSTPTTVATKPQPSTKPHPLCPDKWTYFEETNSCYYWTDLLEWDKGEKYCLDNDAHLASIHSSAEFNYTSTIYNGNVWIGMYTLDSTVNVNTIWRWTDNSAVDYSSWSWPYFPSFNSWKCVQFYSDGKNPIGYRNVNCSTKSYAICKKPSSVILPSTAPIATTTPRLKNCTDGWTYNANLKSCYLLTPNLNWTSAEQFCNYYGSHLASVHSDDESDYIYNTWGGYYNGNVLWIGLISDSDAIVWNWTDGSAFDYRNWDHGYPQRGGSPCGCTISRTFSNSQQCDRSDRVGICKKPALEY